MKTYVALLRAVNVAGTGKVIMKELEALCGAIGFADVGTYLASGNVIFRSDIEEGEIRRKLEAAIAAELHVRTDIFVRSAEAMGSVLTACPYQAEAGNRVGVAFLEGPPDQTMVDAIKGRSDEQVALGAYEIFIHYPSGMGRSKLALPAAVSCTVRNRNTVENLAAMSAELDAKSH